MVSQLFDGATFFAADDAPLPKSAPEVEDGPLMPYSPDAELPLLEAAHRFDWDGYAQHLGENWTRDTAIQSYLGGRLPQAALKDFLLEIRANTLWRFLNDPTRRLLKNQALRGFQQTPNLLRHDVVRGRLAAHFLAHPLEFPILFMVWQQDEPPILSHLETDDQTLRQTWPTLVKTFGMPALIYGVIVRARIALYREIVPILQTPDELLRMVEEAPSLEEATEVISSNEAAPELPIDWKAQFESAEAARIKLKNQNLELQRGANEIREKSTRLERELEVLKKQETRSTLAANKKRQNLETKLRAELDDLQKRFDRLERRFKKTEGERDELEISGRRLQKQLRANSQLLVEEQRRVAALERAADQPVGKVEDAPKTEPKAAPLPANIKQRPAKIEPPSPLDEVFEWEANGRRVRFTAREVKRQLDRNDEDLALDLALAIEGADERNLVIVRRFLERLKRAGEWIPRIVTGSPTRVLVDASNVARAEKDALGRGKLRVLLALRDELRRRGCWPVVLIADASLRHNIDDRAAFEAMLQSGEIEQTDKGVEADEILAREARRTGAYVITNDARFFHKVSPDFEPPRISFSVFAGDVSVGEF